MSLFIPYVNIMCYLQLPITFQIVHYCQDNLGYYISDWFLKGNMKLEIYAKNNLVPCIVLNPI